MTSDEIALEIARSIQLGRPTKLLEDTGYYFSYIHAATDLSRYIIEQAKALEENPVCVCAKIQKADAARHFKGCPMRLEVEKVRPAHPGNLDEPA